LKNILLFLIHVTPAAPHHLDKRIAVQAAVVKHKMKGRPKLAGRAHAAAQAGDYPVHCFHFDSPWLLGYLLGITITYHHTIPTVGMLTE
jgi:hypothetical protein